MQDSVPIPVRPQATILLAEDDEPIRRLLRLCLEKLDYRVLAAASGGEALRIAQNLPPAGIDLLISDLLMPEVSGAALAERLRSGNPRLKVLFISGCAEHFPPLTRGEGSAQLQKPFTMRELAESVRSLLER